MEDGCRIGLFCTLAGRIVRDESVASRAVSSLAESTVVSVSAGTALGDRAIQSIEEVLLAANSGLKAAAGVGERVPSVQDVDVACQKPANCEAGKVVVSPVTVEYRLQSPMSRGDSLGELELLMTEDPRCEGGVVHFEQHPSGEQDATPYIRPMRPDEPKYLFSAT